MPQYSLPGLVAYLRNNKYTQAALVKRIEKYARKIRATVYRYKVSDVKVRKRICMWRFLGGLFMVQSMSWMSLASMDFVNAVLMGEPLY